MSKNCEDIQVINCGYGDSMDILQDYELSEVLGGKDIVCKKGFMMSDTGVIECGCGFKLVTDIGDPSNPFPGPAPCGFIHHT